MYDNLRWLGQKKEYEKFNFHEKYFESLIKVIRMHEIKYFEMYIK